VAVYPYKISDSQELAEAVIRIGADPRSIPFFDTKKKIIPIFISDIDCRAANALKQEMLSRDGDVIVHRNCIDCGIENANIILLGTEKQYHLLITKLDFMPYWGLNVVKEDLERIVKSIRRERWSLSLPDGESLELGKKTIVMGILNLTNDSFYTPSRTGSEKIFLERTAKMLEQGATILDVGAESTRPGAKKVSAEEERAKIIPAVKTLKQHFPHAIISIDTYKAQIAKEAAIEGAHIINDISGMTFDPEMAETIAGTGTAVIINHIQGTPTNMQEIPQYGDIMGEITDWFGERLDSAAESGISPDKIILDPGIGFGKTLEHNLTIFKNLYSLKGLGFPLLIGHSRKSFIDKLHNHPDPKDRLIETLAVSALCAMENIQIIRVHDVRENVEIIDTIEAVKEAGHVRNSGNISGKQPRGPARKVERSSEDNEKVRDRDNR